MQRKPHGIVTLVALLLSFFALTPIWSADDIPRIIPYQGWVQVDGSNFNGTGTFKFSIVNAADDTTYWSHDGTSAGGSEPSGTPISAPVTNGLFAARPANILLLATNDGVKTITQ